MSIVKSVDRALEILNTFDADKRELSITEISEKVKLNKSTIHSLLKTLKKHGYIIQNKDNKNYMLGFKIFERGNIVINHLKVQSIAKEYLEKLSAKTNLTAHLVILDNQEGLYIDKVEGGNVTIVYSRIGRRVPLHTSAVGKAMLATKTKQELQNL